MIFFYSLYHGCCDLYDKKSNVLQIFPVFIMLVSVLPSGSTLFLVIYTIRNVVE